MTFYRQIAVLVLFFLILILFVYPDQSGILFPLLKGIAVGGLVIVFISFAFPQVFQLGEGHLNSNDQSEDNANESSYSSAVKNHYNKLLLQILNLIRDINPQFSAAIYMIDPENKGYTCQEKSKDDFRDFIEDGNDIIAPIIKKSNLIINRKSDKNPGWDGIIDGQTWRGSETLMGFPILFTEKTVGCLLVFVDHFSSIHDRDQGIIEKLSQFISHGMEDLERMESLMVDNYFNARIANLFDQLEVKSDESELFQSIRGLCRAFFQYDKLTIVLLKGDKNKAEIKLVDGLHDDADEGEEFHIQNTLHGLAVQDNKIFCSNSWFDKYPELNRFKPDEKDEFNFMSVLSVPLKSGGKPIGAVTMERLKSKIYSETDIRLFELLCGTVSSILNWQQEYKKMHLTSIHDGLTGLLTHRAFLDRFEEEINRAGRFNQMLGLVVLDLDKFKTVNDSYGHLYGDYVLQEVSKIISDNVRTIDVVGRYGGEEFAVLLVNTDIKQCIPLAQRIVESIAKKTFLSNGIAVKITVSAGMAGFPYHSDQVRDLIYKADKAMYKTKSDGGNGVTIIEGG
ncbi:MAG: sensor domain-containing diguanylate cyclase [Candidatus Marinimicrobia bacterium]|jgi:diguanylate cyclase (GGDEF)-like protein|nr:sensor domain-containing diguanylate cyclase [Candidatus Neomarinimicrobiota bacterium]|tara:strand:+ start:24098 stop:25795 length:1698 start_codon:yes stop_codon:yes gene_type:complete